MLLPRRAGFLQSIDLSIEDYVNASPLRFAVVGFLSGFLSSTTLLYVNDDCLIVRACNLNPPKFQLETSTRPIIPLFKSLYSSRFIMRHVVTGYCRCPFSLVALAKHVINND